MQKATFVLSLLAFVLALGTWLRPCPSTLVSAAQQPTAISDDAGVPPQSTTLPEGTYPPLIQNCGDGAWSNGQNGTGNKGLHVLEHRRREQRCKGQKQGYEFCWKSAHERPSLAMSSLIMLALMNEPRSRIWRFQAILGVEGAPVRNRRDVGESAHSVAAARENEYDSEITR
jgi:hypothetical protein